MTDKTDLIDQIKLHVGFMKAADNPVSDHYHLKEIKRLFIEQACEAVDEFILNLETIQYDAGGITEEQEQLLHMAQQAIRDRFKPSED